MTIHSDWARLLHDECPEAFHEQIPHGDYGVGVIDGHLQLMCLHAGFETWDAFVHAMFVRPIEQLFAAGCPTVVLCFDSYDHVPIYKSMTQAKRARPHKVCVFGPDQDLPPQIPDDTMVYLMNRHFKLKVIQLACARVPPLVCQKLLRALPEHRGRRFIIDYKRVVEYSLGDFASGSAAAALAAAASADAPITPVPLPDLVPLGESDIKFVRYVEKYGNALVHAIDGDYMVIALLYYASCGLRDDNRVFLFRQLSRLHPTAAASAAASAAAEEEAANNTKNNNSANNKRKRPSAAAGAAAATAPAAPAEAAACKKKKKTPKCWVDMQLLYSVLAIGVRQSVRGGSGGSSGGVPASASGFSDADAVHAAITLMLCAGTDFSRPIPLVGPKRLWEHLPLFAAAMLRAAPLAAPLDTALFGDAVIAKLYRTVFAKHIGLACVGRVEGDGQMLEAVLRQLRTGSSLSATTCARLPSPEQVEVTLQNIEWVMGYWQTYNSRMPAPLDGTHGFVRCPATNAITFADLVAVGAASPS